MLKLGRYWPRKTVSSHLETWVLDCNISALGSYESCSVVSLTGPRKTIILCQFCCSFFTLSLSCVHIILTTWMLKNHHMMIQRPVIQIERGRGHLERLFKRPLFYLQRNYLIIFTITTNYLRSQGNENLDSSWTNMPSFELHPFVLPMLSLSVITVRFCWTSPCSSKNTSYPRIPKKKRERDRHLWIREKLDPMKERDKNKQLVKIRL